MNDKAEVQELKEQEDIKAALKQTTGTKEAVAKPVAQIQDKIWFGTYILFLLGLAALNYLVSSNFFAIDTQYVLLLQRLLTGAIVIVLVLALAKSIRVYLISQIENTPARYNLERVLNLILALAILIIGLSVLSATGIQL